MSNLLAYFLSVSAQRALPHNVDPYIYISNVTVKLTVSYVKVCMMTKLRRLSQKHIC